MATQDFVPSTSTELHERISSAHGRFSDLLGGVSPDLAVGSWTSREVAAHLVNVVNRYNAFEPRRIAADPRGVDGINQDELEPLATRSLSELLDALDAEMALFGDLWGPERGIALDAPLPFHGGATIDVQSGLTNLIGEFLVHGLDVAAVAGRPWLIDARDGALLCGFASQIIPSYVRLTNRHDLLIHLDLQGVAPWALEVSGPTAVSRAPGGEDRPDVVLEGPALPVPLVLYGRIGSVDLEAEGLRVGGSHPERVADLDELFEVP